MLKILSAITSLSHFMLCIVMIVTMPYMVVNVIGDGAPILTFKDGSHTPLAADLAVYGILYIGAIRGLWG